MGCPAVGCLAWWAIHLWGLLAHKPSEAAAPPGAITPDRSVASIADEYPRTLDVFEEFGFKELRNPVLRRTLARKVTVRMACGMKQVDEEKFLAELRARAAE